jgi:hypothetical protein
MARAQKGRSHAMATCTHAHGATLCFECFRAGMERTRARRLAWAQRSLPFEAGSGGTRELSEQDLAHRRRMLAYLESAARRGA